MSESEWEYMERGRKGDYATYRRPKGSNGPWERHEWRDDGGGWGTYTITRESPVIPARALGGALEAGAHGEVLSGDFTITGDVSVTTATDRAEIGRFWHDGPRVTFVGEAEHAAQGGSNCTSIYVTLAPGLRRTDDTPLHRGRRCGRTPMPRHGGAGTAPNHGGRVRMIDRDPGARPDRFTPPTAEERAAIRARFIESRRPQPRPSDIPILEAWLEEKRQAQAGGGNEEPPND